MFCFSSELASPLLFSNSLRNCEVIVMGFHVDATLVLRKEGLDWWKLRLVAKLQLQSRAYMLAWMEEFKGEGRAGDFSEWTLLLMTVKPEAQHLVFTYHVHLATMHLNKDQWPRERTVLAWTEIWLVFTAAQGRLACTSSMLQAWWALTWGALLEI